MGTRISKQPWRNTERYSLDGHWLNHRVTSVCGVLDKGDGLRKWYALQAALWVRDHVDETRTMSPEQFKRAAYDAPDLMRDAAARKGTSLHELFELVGGGDAVDVPLELASRVQLLADFYDRHDVDVLASEAIVYHDGLRYAGTLDAVVELDIGTDARAVWLLDLKTGGIYREVCLQLAAYRHATHVQIDGEDVPMPALGITGSGVLQLTADDWHLVPVNSGTMPWETFKHLLAVRDAFTTANEDELFRPALPKPELAGDGR